MRRTGNQRQEMLNQLFSQKEFLQFQNKMYPNPAKKLLESRLQKNAASQSHKRSSNKQILEDVTSESEPEVFNKESQTFRITYEDEEYDLPNILLDLDSLSSVLTPDSLKSILSDPEDLSKALSLLPDLPGQKTLSHLESFIRDSPAQLDKLLLQLKKGHFTSYYYKQLDLQEQINKKHMLNYYKGLLQEIDRKQRVARNRRGGKGYPSYYEVFEEDSDLSSLEQIHVQGIYAGEDDISAALQSGVSEEAQPNNNNLVQQQRNNNHQTNEDTQTEEEASESDAEGMAEKQVTEILFKYDKKAKTQEQLIAMTEQKPEYKTKYKIPVSTLAKASSTWIQIYRRQEQQRYINPTKPWTYVCEDNRRVTVAPVAKKIAQCGGKPREHPLLKQQRPACVTILTLVRDAAARLPGGVGTRADICQLLKQSQYINQDMSDEKISIIVSGALDRLHYLQDACVKYDSEKKLWLYLHLDRDEFYTKWGDEAEDKDKDKQAGKAAKEVKPVEKDKDGVSVKGGADDNRDSASVKMGSEPTKKKKPNKSPTDDI